MLARSGLAWFALPFGNVCFSSLCRWTHLSSRRLQFSLGDPNVFVRRIFCPCLCRVRSKRFCAEDRGFLSGADISESSLASLAIVLELELVAMFTGTVGSPLDCEFCGMSLCAWPGLSGCPPFLAGRCYVGGSVARVFIVGFLFCPTVCCDGFVIRCCLLCFVEVGTVRGTLVCTGQSISSQRSSTCAGPWVGSR